MLVAMRVSAIGVGKYRVGRIYARRWNRGKINGAKGGRKENVVECGIVRVQSGKNVSLM